MLRLIALSLGIAAPKTCYVVSRGGRDMLDKQSRSTYLCSSRTERTPSICLRRLFACLVQRLCFVVLQCCARGCCHGCSVWLFSRS